jgi:multiple sugar transport system ATP-binding protein
MADEVVLESVTKKFASLCDFTLSVKRGEFVVVVGPSGCGKSTTLRLVAGLEEPDAGTISICGRAMKGVPPQERDVAMVFQSYALYPQMTAREILEFPLRMRKVAAGERERAVKEAAALLRIERLMERRPGEMSGGERQRVAMGRAIVRKPRVFLFDEPLSNLDAALRGDLRLEIGALVRRLEATAVYVTHDHVEAMTLADRIAVMRSGKLLQFATAREVYEKPASAFVGTFIGTPRMNLFTADVDNGKLHAGSVELAIPRCASLPEKVLVGVRPEDVRLASEGIRAEIAALEPLGAETHLIVRVGEIELRAKASGFAEHARGDTVQVAIDPAKIHLFDPAKDGARIHESA